MNPVDVKSRTYIESSKGINNKNPKYKINNTVRIPKYKTIFAKDYTPNWSEEVFVIKKVKNALPWTYAINDLTGEEIVGIFYKEKLPQTNKKKLSLKKK